MNKGDHIYIHRTGYTHHGLYMGNNEVIHYEGASLDDPGGGICTTSLSDFSDGQEVHTQPYLFRVYDAEESVERARSKEGDENYNLLFNNCEHFVVWCIMGLHFSSQVMGGLSATASFAPQISIFFSNLIESDTEKEAFIAALKKAGIQQAVLSELNIALSSAGTTAIATTASAVSSTAAYSAITSTASGALFAAPILVPVIALTGLGGLAVLATSETARDAAEDIAGDCIDMVGDALCGTIDAVGDVLEGVIGGIGSLFDW